MSLPLAKREGRNHEPSLFRSLSLPVKIGIVTGMVLMTAFDYHMANIATFSSVFGGSRSSYTPPVTSTPPASVNTPALVTPPVIATPQSRLESFDRNVLTATHPAAAFESNWFQFALGETEYGKSPGNLAQVLGHYGEIYGLSKAKQTELANFWNTPTQSLFADRFFVEGQVSGWVAREKNGYSLQLSEQTSRFTYLTLLSWTIGDKQVKFQTFRTERGSVPINAGAASSREKKAGY